MWPGGKGKFADSVITRARDNVFMAEEITTKTDLATRQATESPPQTEQARHTAANKGRGQHLSAYWFKPGCPSPNPSGHPKGLINKASKLKHEMLDVMGRNRKARMKVLTAALEKDGLRYLNILASLLPKEQVVDLSVHGGLSVLAAQMTDEELLRLAMATGTEVIETEPDGETDDENEAKARGSAAERSPIEDGDTTPA